MKIRSTQTRLAVLSLLAGLPLATLAQAPQLTETVVTATRVEQPRQAQPALPPQR